MVFLLYRPTVHYCYYLEQPLRCRKEGNNKIAFNENVSSLTCSSISRPIVVAYSHILSHNDNFLQSLTRWSIYVLNLRLVDSNDLSLVLHQVDYSTSRWSIRSNNMILTQNQPLIPQLYGAHISTCV